MFNDILHSNGIRFIIIVLCIFFVIYPVYTFKTNIDAKAIYLFKTKLLSNEVNTQYKYWNVYPLKCIKKSKLYLIML